MKKFAILAATAAMAAALAAPAFAADTDVKAETTLNHSSNGGYDKTTTASKKTPSGKIEDQAETKLDVDSNGDNTKTTTVKHTNDPKGLLNKHTSKTTVKQKTKDGVTSTERTDKVDGKTVSETSTDVSK